MGTFDDNKSDQREGKKTITKLFTGLISDRVANDCHLGLRMLQNFQDFGQRFSLYGPPSHLANNIHVSKNLNKHVFQSTYTNKIYRFVKLPLFAVAQGMLNNFVMLVYV